MAQQGSESCPKEETMSTQTIISNMNYLPSFVTPSVETPKKGKEVSCKQAKYWRFSNDKLAIQPTGGLKPATRTSKGTDRPLNFEMLYVAYVIDGAMRNGTSMKAGLIFDVIKANTTPILKQTMEDYLANLKELQDKLTPEQLQMLSH
jgi:hypothetical protein